MAGTNSARATGVALTKRILLTIAEAGGAVVENFIDPYGKLRVANMFIDEGKIQRYRLRRKLLAMEAQGLVSVKEKRGEIKISLEPEGHIRALRYAADDLVIKKPDWWDRKWRIVLFDVPEELRSSRNMFKLKLDEFGFIQLQHSVYVHPYECHNEIELTRTAYGLKEYVKILLVDKIEGEAALRKRFNI